MTRPLRTLLLLSLLLPACKDGDGPNIDSVVEDVDADGDGVPESEDCDDNDADATPGAEELCDGVDNDCDGLVDNGASDASTWYADLDGDGFGDPGDSETGCEPSPDHVADNTDCDDLDTEINPDADEVCDGVDNDCNGQIDDDAIDASTWYADLDGDGYGDADNATLSCDAEDNVADDTDCDDTDAQVYPGAPESWYDQVDSDCDGAEEPDVCDEVPGGAVIADDPTCTYTPNPPSSWAIEVEWSTDPSEGWVWSVGTSYTRVMMTPMVGQLTDDNGDGQIDDGDIPDIAFNTFSGSGYSSGGYLRVVSGDGGGEHLSLNTVTDGSSTWTIAASGGIALGDIEGDGSPDILTMSTAGDVLALEHDGTFKWVGAVAAGSRYTYPAIADMDGDGVAEVLAGANIYDAYGALLGTAATHGQYSSFAADLDGDGVLEHIGGNSVSAMDGTVIWQDSTVNTGFSAVMDWDGDGYGDVLNQRSGALTVFDTWGTVLVSASISGGASGAPCVGDFDGDGAPEVAVAGSNALTMLDNDGTVLWTEPSSDGSSSGTPCTAWDFDGDGAFEVLLADETDFYIRDGSTGAALLHEPNHASGTIREQPVPVDVDRDGNTEIVLANNDYYRSPWDGVYVLGESNDEWTSTRTTWNQAAFWSGNINEDLSVPTAALMPWDLENSFRSQRSPTTDPLASQDYRADILGVCEDCSAGTVDVWVAVENGGAVWGPAGLNVALYRDDGGALTLLDVQQTTATVNAGERLAPLTFTIPVGDLGSNGVVAFVDDDGTGQGDHNECDESNNGDSWDEEVCVE